MRQASLPPGQEQGHLWRVFTRGASDTTHATEDPVVTSGNSHSHLLQTSFTGVRPGATEALKASVLPHADLAAGLSTCFDGRGEDAENMLAARSTLDSLGRASAGRASVLSTESTMGTDVLPESTGRIGFLASVMQQVEDLIVDHFWRLEGDLLNVENMVKARVEEAQIQQLATQALASQFSQLVEAREADRRELQELRDEVQALRSERTQNAALSAFYPASSCELAAATDAAAVEEKLADFEVRLATVQESIHECRCTQKAMCRRLVEQGRPTRSSSPPVISFQSAKDLLNEEKSVASLPLGVPIEALPVKRSAFELSRPSSSSIEQHALLSSTGSSTGKGSLTVRVNCGK
mmetsp:Transcript_84840/g.150233  ORF Transcript_84840/g.150233 Transcript_84840/m.150233 type:complete len:352 (-) Transcript_84840:152-1207(-)